MGESLKKPDGGTKVVGRLSGRTTDQPTTIPTPSATLIQGKSQIFLFFSEATLSPGCRLCLVHFGDAAGNSNSFGLGFRKVDARGNGSHEPGVACWSFASRPGKIKRESWN